MPEVQLMRPQHMSHLRGGARQHLAADSWPGGCRKPGTTRR